MSCILVVEDSPGQLARMIQLLRGAGHEVVGAQDWAECRTTLHTTVPDLVILDVNLGGVQGGDVLAIQLKKHPQLRGARIAFHSACREGDLQVMTRRAGAAGYIVKGSSDEAFLRAVSRLLDFRSRPICQ